MCRLGLFNRKFLEEKGKKYMFDFLNQLEKSCGGHGNGVLFVDNNKISFTHKGKDFKNSTIIELLYESNEVLPEWFIYHTRVASQGSIKDENCHPYVNKDDSFALMMNGTVSSFGAFGKYMGDITDTDVIFRVVDKFNLDLACLTGLSPRFLGFKDGKVFASNSSGYSGLEYFEQDGMIAIASESPINEIWDNMKEEYVWYEGEKIEKKIQRAYAYSYYENWRGKYLYGDKKTKEDEQAIVFGSLNGVQGYWKGDKFTPFKETKEETKKKEKTKEKEEITTIKEAIEKIEEIRQISENWDMVSLQNAIDDEFGVAPILDNMYCDIMVLDTQEIVIQDEFGSLHF